MGKKHEKTKNAHEDMLRQGLQSDESRESSANEAARSQAINTRTAMIWVDEDNIIRKEFHEHAEETLKDALESMEAIKRISQGRRYPLLINLTNVHSMDREARDYYTGNDAFSLASAAAAVTSSFVSRVIGNFFLGFNKPVYPRKVFNSEDEAIAWLKNFL